MYTTNRFVLQELVGVTWRVSDCEELVGSSVGANSSVVRLGKIGCALSELRT